MQGQRKELLLQMLAESTDFLSGEKLAGELGISRAAVWKMIASLRQEGYCIEAVKKRGYLLRETDVLSAQQIRRALAKPWREIPIQVYDCIDSTNTQAKRQLSAGWRGEAILTAQEQTAGRGRRGRHGRWRCERSRRHWRRGWPGRRRRQVGDSGPAGARPLSDV